MQATTRIPISRYMTPVPVTIGVDEPLGSAQRLMREYHVRHLPVVRRGELVGVISERDLYFMERFDADSMTIAEAMSPSPFVVRPETGLKEVAEKMAQEKFGSAVVTENGRVVGIFTVVDALRAISDILVRPGF